jgi:hypothetical protein
MPELLLLNRRKFDADRIGIFEEATPAVSQNYFLESDHGCAPIYFIKLRGGKHRFDGPVESSPDLQCLVCQLRGRGVESTLRDRMHLILRAGDKFVEPQFQVRGI